VKTNKISQHLAVVVTFGLSALGQALGANADKTILMEAERIVSQYTTVMNEPPRRVPSRDTVDGPLLGNGSLGAVISGKPESQRFWISKNNFWRLTDGHRKGGPRLFGGLEIQIPALSNATYLVEQQFYPAMTTSRFVNGNTNVVMRSFVAATEDVLIIELSVTGAPVDVATRMWAAPGRGSLEDLGRKDAILWATKAFTNDVKIPTAAACALTVVGAKVTHPDLEPVPVTVIPDPPPRRMPPPKEKSQPGPKFTLQPGRTVTIAVAMRSSFDAKEPLVSAQKLALDLNADKLKALEQEHRQWWSEYWAKSLVEIGDPILEKNYYAANYCIGSAMRDLEFPTGLYGLWVTSDDPRWAGDYHLNFDYQSQFYALYKCNHLEQANAYHAPILEFMERGRWYAKNLLNVRGVYYSVGIGAKGIETCRKGNLTDRMYQAGGCFMGQKCNAAYSVVPMSMHWYHTYDKDYAKTVYPFVLEVANFWEDYLRFEPNDRAGKPTASVATNALVLPPVAMVDGVPVDKIPVSKLPPGRYVIYNDSIQESGDIKGLDSQLDVNSSMSLGLVRNAFETAIDMSEELGIDADRREKWKHILGNLSAFPTCERNGKIIFRYSERGTEWIDGNSCGTQHIYPSGAIGLDDDPKLLEIARNMITARGAFWFNNNGENSQYPAAVRVGYDPDVILEKLGTLMTTTRKRPNGMPETVEQCSTVPGTITEMLCMSHRQVLRVFPVWPKNKDAKFLNLRAEGAFLVSSELKGGQVTFVKVVSEKGRPCTLVNPWPGKAIGVQRDGRKVDTLKGERVVLKTRAGETIVLGPEG